MNDDAQRSARSQVALLIVDLQRGMQRHDLPPRNNPGAEALRDRLDQAYDQLRSDGADLSLL